MSAWASGAWAADAWAIGTWEGIVAPQPEVIGRRSGGFVRRPVIYVKNKKTDDEEIIEAVLEALPAVPIDDGQLRRIVESLVRGKAPRLKARERRFIDLGTIRAEIDRQRRLAFIRQQDDDWLMSF